MMLSRRGLILGAGAFLAAPAIVRASSLMPVRALAFSKAEALFDECFGMAGYSQATRFFTVPGWRWIESASNDPTDWTITYSTEAQPDGTRRFVSETWERVC